MACLNMPYSSQARVIIPIQAAGVILGPVLKWTFSKLPASNVDHVHGVGITRDCQGQVAADCRNVLEFECFVRVHLYFLGFH